MYIPLGGQWYPPPYHWQVAVSEKGLSHRHPRPFHKRLSVYMLSRATHPLITQYQNQGNQTMVISRFHLQSILLIYDLSQLLDRFKCYFILPALFFISSATCGPFFLHTFLLPGRFESKRSAGHQLFSIVYPSVASSR